MIREPHTWNPGTAWTIPLLSFPLCTPQYVSATALEMPYTCPLTFLYHSTGKRNARKAVSKKPISYFAKKGVTRTMLCGDKPRLADIDLMGQDTANWQGHLSRRNIREEAAGVFPML